MFLIKISITNILFQKIWQNTSETKKTQTPVDNRHFPFRKSELL